MPTPTSGATPGTEGSSQLPDGSTDDVVVAPGEVGDDAGPDDDSDDEDYTDVPFHEHPRFKALTRKLAKTKRQLSKARPLADRVKDLNLDELILKARTSDQLQEALAGNPRLRQATLEAIANPQRNAEPDEPEFDPSTLPFDVNDESGKFFANFYKEFREVQKQNKQLRERLDGLNERDVQTARVTESRAWAAAAKAAEAQVPEPYREMFHDAVAGAFREARQRKVVVDPMKVINHYLTRLGGNKGNQVKASAAAAQRIAESNKKLPHQPANAGAPAGARGDRKETVSDVSRRLRKEYAR